MIICSAQSNAQKGNISANIEAHKKFIEKAVTHQAAIVLFPELSLTGYEPMLAEKLATSQDDPRLDVFQILSDKHGVIIGVGIPTINMPRPAISMVIFHPQQASQIYSKKYIHIDEEPFFVSGENSLTQLGNYHHIALAICYEISVPQHAQAASDNGAEIYLASVAKTQAGVENAHKRLSEIARQYAMTVILTNCVGVADGEICGGRSAVWNGEGEMVGEMDDTNEGLLIFDTDSQTCTIHVVH